MVIMSKKVVERYLENLLVDLEVNPSEEIQIKFVNTINRYNKVYDLQKYIEKEAQISYNKKEEK